MLVHPASVGHGLNLLDGGHHLAFFSLTWNYEHYAQVIERIGPIRQHQAGHPRPVFVYQIQAEGTLDQVVQARVEGKADVQDLLMEYCKMKSPVKGFVALDSCKTTRRSGLSALTIFNHTAINVE